MGKFYDHIPDRLVGFMQRSKIFYVATAPLEGGSVNVSPKANEQTFEVVDQNRVRYLDLTGSGNETISHLLQKGNGRITLMFANIEEGAPNIVRLFGKGCVRERGLDTDTFDERWSTQHDGARVPIGGRAIIDIAVHTCSTSCGYSLPVYAFQRKRTVLDDFHGKYDKLGIESMIAYKKSNMSPDSALIQSPEGKSIEENEDDKDINKLQTRPMQNALEAYWALCNNLSIDGLPGMQSVRGLLDVGEQNALQEKAKLHEALQPPKDDLGTFKPAPIQDKRPAKAVTATANKTLQQSTTHFLHLFLAFAAGCILTAAFSRR